MGCNRDVAARSGSFSSCAWWPWRSEVDSSRTWGRRRRKVVKAMVASKQIRTRDLRDLSMPWTWLVFEVRNFIHGPVFSTKDSESCCFRSQFKHKAHSFWAPVWFRRNTKVCNCKNNQKEQLETIPYDGRKRNGGLSTRTIRRKLGRECLGKKSILTDKRKSRLYTRIREDVILSDW